MKVCPSCNESFGDDLNFCDVDGTRLERHRDVASTGDRSRAWSFLGAGLLIGALALSAASIIFFPKARVTPTVASSLPSNGTNSGQSQTAPSAVTQPEIVVEEPPAEEVLPAETKKKDKLAGLMNANANANANVSVPDPKAVALEREEAEDSSKRASEPAVTVPVELKDPEPTPARTEVESRDPGKDVKAVPAVDPKKDPKKDPKAKKDSSKDASKKKEDGKDKKKGGFFGVFKKIFGKN